MAAFGAKKVRRGRGVEIKVDDLPDWYEMEVFDSLGRRRKTWVDLNATSPSTTTSKAMDKAQHSTRRRRPTTTTTSTSTTTSTISLGSTTRNVVPDVNEEADNTDTPQGPAAEAGQSAHAQRQRSEQNRWADLRQTLLDTRLKSLEPATNCVRCGKEENSIILCPDCGPNAFFCHQCSNEFHSILHFHKPYIWKEDMLYMPVNATTLLTQLPGHRCDETKVVDLVVFDHQGFSLDVKVWSCGHEELAVTLLRHGLWPATPSNPQFAFTMQLMELCACMQLYGSMTVQAFASSLKELNFLMGLKACANKNLYRNLLGAINEYRHHRSEMMRKGSPELVDLHSCAICKMDPSRSVIALDGNFGLVHKERGDSGTKSRHGNLFFHQDKAVQQFVTQWEVDGCKKKTPVQDCSQFQASDALRSKNKTKKLDITGVFGSVCQHEFPGIMVNLKHGERLSYPAYVLNQVSALRQSGNATKQLIMYDIGCVLHKHLCGRKSNLSSMFRFSVPAFHRFAHGIECQITFGQRCTDGAGLFDGKGMERVWAYLRQFAAATKHMSLMNREDLLTDALLAYSLKSFQDLGRKLLRQLDSAKRLKVTSQEVFQPIGKQSAQGTAPQEWLDVWRGELAQAKRTRGANNRTPQEAALSSALNLAKERKFLMQLLAKYTDGQSIAARLGKQLQKNSQDMGKVLQELAGFGLSVSQAEALNIDNEIYKDLTCGITPTMMKAALARADYRRACEAEDHAKKDMNYMLVFLQQSRQKLEDAINVNVNPSSVDSVEGKATCQNNRGKRHLLCHQLLMLDTMHEQFFREFSGHIIVEPHLVFTKSGLQKKLALPSPEPICELEVEELSDAEKLDLQEDIASDLDDLE